VGEGSDGFVSPEEFIEALLVAPAGAVFLGRLEAQERSDVPWWDIPDTADLGAMGDVVSGLQARPVGELLALAVDAAESNAGPWNQHAPAKVATALSTAPDRRALDAAVVERLGSILETPLEPDSQEWWWSPWPWEVTARFRPLGEGEHSRMRAWCTASWEGIWTVSAPDDELADSLVSTWELDYATSRWHLAVDDSARVFEVDGPGDWERLVRGYTAEGQVGGHWELPSPDQGNVEALAKLDGQRAMRTNIGRFLVPDWNAVAEDWDGVHLTWGGFLTTEGLVIDMGDDDVAMLRGWGSERTLFLNPVLSDPEPLERPALTGRVNGNVGVDVRTDFERRAGDFEWLKRRLGQ
jgi:hypothetical protein